MECEMREQRIEMVMMAGRVVLTRCCSWTTMTISVGSLEAIKNAVITNPKTKATLARYVLPHFFPFALTLDNEQPDRSSL